MRLLLVDDDEPLMEALTSRLSNQRYAIDIATASEMAWEFIDLFTYDLVVLDRMLPDTDGISLCQKLRAKGHSMPILMLTARGDNPDVIDGLNAGADDYVAKPFDFDQLVARIHALLRRNQKALPPILRWGDLSLNPDTFEVMNGDRPLNLTAKEYALLELLLRNRNHVFTVDAIIERIWTFDPPSDSAVRTHMKCLRQKLKAADASPDMIETVYGIGYRLKTPPDRPAPEASARGVQATKVIESDTSAEMAEVLSNFRVAADERITVLEGAATALKADDLSDERYQQAIASAHKLAGSLGSFGFPEGSMLAKAIEGYLKSKSLEVPAAKQQFYANLSALRRVVSQDDASPSATELAVTETLAAVDLPELAPLGKERPLLLIVSDDSEFTQALARAGTAYQLSIAIATSFSQAKGVIEADDPAIILLHFSQTLESSNAQTTSTGRFEILERLHHQAPSLPIVAIADMGNLTERLDIIRRGAHILLFQPIDPKQAIAAVAQLLKQTGAGAKVLIIDDDPHVLKRIQISLAPWGFEVATLDNPHKFLTVLDEVAPDLLVLDVDMPDVNGLELCQVLRSEPRWQRLPVIFLTVHQDAKTQHQAFAIGADDYVEKPILGAELANRILNRLARSHILPP